MAQTITIQIQLELPHNHVNLESHELDLMEGKMIELKEWLEQRGFVRCELYVDGKVRERA